MRGEGHSGAFTCSPPVGDVCVVTFPRATSRGKLILSLCLRSFRIPSRYTWSLLKQPAKPHQGFTERPRRRAGVQLETPLQGAQSPGGQVCALTWLRRVALASLGSDAVVPAGVGVLDEAAQAAEELAEGHEAGLVDGVVEQSGAPQGGVFPEEDAVDAGQTLLCGVEGLQAELPPALAPAPRLLAVVNAPEIVGAFGTSKSLRSAAAAACERVCGVDEANPPISCLSMPSSQCSRAVEALMVSVGLLFTTVMDARDRRSSVTWTTICPHR